MVSKIELTLPYQDNDFLKLPEDILLNIFNITISGIEDLPKLSLVCRDFNRLLEDDRIWQVFANKKGYRKIDGFSHRDCCLIAEKEIKTASDLIDKIKYCDTCEKVSALIKLLKINFSEELSKKVEDQMKYIQPMRVLKMPRQGKLIRTYYQLNEIEKAHNVIEKSAYFDNSDKERFGTMRYDYEKEKASEKYKKLKKTINKEESIEEMESIYHEKNVSIRLKAYPKLIRVCLQLNKTKEAEDLYEKITNPYLQVLAQIYFLKANPSKDALEKTMAEIEKLPDNPMDSDCGKDHDYHKAIAKIKFVKVFFYK